MSRRPEVDDSDDASGLPSPWTVAKVLRRGKAAPRTASAKVRRRRRYHVHRHRRRESAAHRWKYDLDPLTHRETAEIRLEEAEDRERAMDEYRAAVVQARTASRRNAAGTQELEGAVSGPALEELGCQGTRALPDGWEEVRYQGYQEGGHAQQQEEWGQEEEWDTQEPWGQQEEWVQQEEWGTQKQPAQEEQLEHQGQQVHQAQQERRQGRAGVGVERRSTEEEALEELRLEEEEEEEEEINTDEEAMRKLAAEEEGLGATARSVIERRSTTEDAMRELVEEEEEQDAAAGTAIERRSTTEDAMRELVEEEEEAEKANAAGTTIEHFSGQHPAARAGVPSAAREGRHFQCERRDETTLGAIQQNANDAMRELAAEEEEATKVKAAAAGIMTERRSTTEEAQGELAEEEAFVADIMEMGVEEAVAREALCQTDSFDAAITWAINYTYSEAVTTATTADDETIHSTMTTTPILPSSTDDHLDQLAAGEPKHVHAQSTTYFYNHYTGESQWERPEHYEGEVVNLHNQEETEKKVEDSTRSEEEGGEMGGVDQDVEVDVVTVADEAVPARSNKTGRRMPPAGVRSSLTRLRRQRREEERQRHCAWDEKGRVIIPLPPAGTPKEEQWCAPRYCHKYQFGECVVGRGWCHPDGTFHPDGVCPDVHDQIPPHVAEAWKAKHMPREKKLDWDFSEALTMEALQARIGITGKAHGVGECEDGKGRLKPPAELAISRRRHMGELDDRLAEADPRYKKVRLDGERRWWLEVVKQCVIEKEWMRDAGEERERSVMNPNTESEMRASTNLLLF